MLVPQLTLHTILQYFHKPIQYNQWFKAQSVIGTEKVKY